MSQSGLTMIDAVGPSFKEDKIYAHVPNAQHTVITGPDVGVPAPEQGGLWYQSASPTITTAIGKFQSGGSLPTFNYYWLVLREFIMRTTVTTGDTFGIIAPTAVTGTYPIGAYMKGEGQSDGKYKIEIWNNASPQVRVGLSSGSWDTDESISIRVEYNGTDVFLWVNEVLEITLLNEDMVPYTTGFSMVRFAGDKAVTKLYRGFLLCGSDDENDRPDEKVWADSMDIAGDHASYDDYGKEATCNVAGEATYTEWDDMNADGAIDEATGNCAAGALSPGEQQSTLANVTPVGDLLGVTVLFWGELGSDKAYGDEVRIRDGSNHTDVTAEDFSFEFGTDPDNRIVVFAKDKAPGSIAWTQTELDNLMAGHKVDSTSNLVHIYAMGVECFAVGNDPPSVAASLVIPRHPMYNLMGR